jgi:lipoyl(octanoyl) transferase
MRSFTNTRDTETPDEVWLLTHPAVYSLGLNTDPKHILGELSAPVIQTDRGGQVTWHGPGQLVIYTLVDLQRRSIGIRAFVSLIENAIIQFLEQYGLQAVSRPDAPGVYILDQKIASIGLKVSRGRAYHGFSINVNPDLTAFDPINPCGYSNLRVTSLEAFNIKTSPEEIMPAVLAAFLDQPPFCDFNERL